MIWVLAGCVPIPPDTINLSEAPSVIGDFCNFTIVRKRQLIGSAPTHYIYLDKVAVASLETGEYTSFPVSVGHHSLTVLRRVGDKLHGVGGFGAGVAVLTWSPHLKSVEIDCRSSENYFFTISSNVFALDENDRLELKQVENHESDFILERNKYVAPGPRKKT
jgi:hypothetical protein